MCDEIMSVASDVGSALDENCSINAFDLEDSADSVGLVDDPNEKVIIEVHVLAVDGVVEKRKPENKTNHGKCKQVQPLLDLLAGALKKEVNMIWLALLMLW